MDHLDQVKSNLQSTKMKKISANDFFSDNIGNPIKTFETISQLICFLPKEFAYGDFTGAFPFKSSRGSKYLYILYSYNSNAILVEPLKTRQAVEIKKAWEKLYQQLTQHGHKMSNFLLDNVFSQDFKKSFNKYNIECQFVPPHIHRANAAERAIRTFKSHFFGELVLLRSTIPIWQWGLLVGPS